LFAVIDLEIYPLCYDSHEQVSDLLPFHDSVTGLASHSYLCCIFLQNRSLGMLRESC
jgi:hypothetical protein